MKPSFETAIRGLLTKKEGMLVQDLPGMLHDIARWLEVQQENLQAVLEPPALIDGSYLIDFPAHPELQIEVHDVDLPPCIRFRGIWCRGADISDLVTEEVVQHAKEQIEYLNAADHSKTNRS
jgi:hypothetical protein